MKSVNISAVIILGIRNRDHGSEETTDREEGCEPICEGQGREGQAGEDVPEVQEADEQV